MIYIEGGTFQMGNERGYDSEKPVHKVTLNDFYISQHPITVKQYRLFCEETGKIMPKEPSWGWRDDHPIINVTWEDAKDYCEWKNGRLPTEAEWEFSARGGNKSKKYKYSGSNQINSVAWYNKNADSKTHIVSSKAPNELNLYDMTGNVWEWCMDYYGNYHGEPQNNPQRPSEGNERTQRGGSWRNYEYQLRLTARRGKKPEYKYDDVGFRLVKEQIEHCPDTPKAEPSHKEPSSILEVPNLEEEQKPNPLTQQVSDLEQQIKRLEEHLKKLLQTTPIQAASRNLLETRLTGLKEQWTLVNQKRSDLEKAKLIETRVEEKIRLTKLIEETEAECKEIEQKINELEAQLDESRK